MKKINGTIPIFLMVTCIILISGLLLQGCHKKEKEEEKSVLENKSIDVSLLSKRSGKDLMENLYDELQERSEALQQLETEIDELGKMKKDSVSLFDRYENKSNTYYDAAYKHANNIQDSLLRLKITAIIDSSLLHYKQLIAVDTSLIQNIEYNHLRLQDLYSILKIVKTLPIMERYQRGYLPADSMLRDLMLRYENLERKVDSVGSLNLIER